MGQPMSSSAPPRRSTRCRPTSWPPRSSGPPGGANSRCRSPTASRRCRGAGCAAWSSGRSVALGKAAWVAPGIDPRWATPIRRRAELDGTLTVFVAIDGEPAGAFLLDDPVRPDAARTIRELRRSGIRRVVMVSGDRADVAEGVGVVLGVDTDARRVQPGGQGRRRRGGAGGRAHDHGRRRHQRRTRAGPGRRRRRHGGEWRDRVLGGRRCRADRRSSRPARRRRWRSPGGLAPSPGRAWWSGSGCRSPR